MRDVASNAPYEVVEILTNSATYGGGGIFGLYSTVAADSVWAPYIFVHEFGHHIAGLADEYYTSDVAYLPAAESRSSRGSRTSTALLDPAELKWKDLVDAGHAAADAVAEGGVRRLTNARSSSSAARSAPRTGPKRRWTRCSATSEKRETRCSARARYAGKVGAFEGANYEANGYYRPQADCIMFTRDNVPFCAVCRRAIERVIGMYT